MTAIHWKFGISGSFELGSNWSTGTVPNPSNDDLTSDDALIDATGTYTVRASVDHVVHDLSVVAGATLDISGGYFVVVGATTNSGTINNYSDLQLGGGLNNTGTIETVGGQATPSNGQANIYVQASGSNAGIMLATNDGNTDGVWLWFGDFSASIGASFSPQQFSNTGLIEASSTGIDPANGFAGVEIDLDYDPVKGGNSFTNYGTIEAGQNGLVEIIFNNIGTGTSINSGSDPFVNNGLLYVDGGEIDIDAAVTGTGSAEVANGGTLAILQSAVFAENITFDAGADGTLQIPTGQGSVTGTVSGFAAGDSIWLPGLAYATTTVAYTANAANTGGTLLITDGTDSTMLTLAGSYVPGGFHIANDGSGYPEITYAAPPPLVTDLAAAADKIALEIQNGIPDKLAFHLTDIGKNALVSAIISDVAAQFESQGTYNINSQGYINPDYIGKNSVSYDQCVALVAGLDTNITLATRNWTQGSEQVVLNGGPNPALVPGVAVPIATFVNGKYPSVNEHAGIFLGYGMEDNIPGFFMLDEYTTQPAQKGQPAIPGEPAEVRFYPFSTPLASEYYNIVDPSSHSTALLVQTMASFGASNVSVPSLDLSQAVPHDSLTPNFLASKPV